MQVLFGAAALSEFKTARLLSSLRAIAPEVQALESTFVHFVDDPELAPAQIDTLTALLTYGERAESSREPQQSRCLRCGSARSVGLAGRRQHAVASHGRTTTLRSSELMTGRFCSAGCCGEISTFS